jgi:tRNA A37 threonylcarbamoyltransferase TsaD
MAHTRTLRKILEKGKATVTSELSRIVIRNLTAVATTNNPGMVLSLEPHSIIRPDDTIEMVIHVISYQRS